MLTNTKRLNPIVRRIQVLFLCILCSFCMQLKAQNVTISPQSGHLISGKTTNPNERGYVAGYGSYWVHNQLPLTFTVSGTPYFTSNDVMTALSGGLKEYQGNLLIATLDFPEYACIALPRGYRIKHIEIKFAADDTFDVPLTPKGISFGHVSLTESGFNVGKVDLGPITRRVKEGKTFYAYDANQLDDINASAILYNDGAVENGKWDATKGNKKTTI